MTGEERREYVRKLVDEMPPLTEEQRADLRQLLRPGVLAARAARQDAPASAAAA